MKQPEAEDLKAEMNEGEGQEQTGGSRRSWVRELASRQAGRRIVVQEYWRER